MCEAIPIHSLGLSGFNTNPSSQAHLKLPSVLTQLPLIQVPRLASHSLISVERKIQQSTKAAKVMKY